MNELKHIADFRKLLADYRPSAAARQILAETRLVLLVGPSSAGRNTIINELVKTGAYHFIVSDTTRQPRTNNGVPEQNGREYWFRTEEEVLAELERGEFLEAAIIHDQQVSGISIRELKRARDANRIAINEVQIDGADNINRFKPDTTIIFVTPPDFESWLARLHARGTLPPLELRRRLESARKEFEAALKYSYYKFVVNNKLEDSVAAVNALATGGQYDPATGAGGRTVVKGLLEATEEYLAQ
ncbi:MAG TPA: hypothetical protein VLG11_00250 [Candidatus Saccharimonadales bacterium]|nr:hypothetical protein [Candidatus Saccharimonadales bacterium]